jgi:integration host factor subunit beta
MNKSDLMMALKEKDNLSRQEAERIVNVFFQSIEDSLCNGGRVEIRGFGSFTVNSYKSYIGRNPKTGDQIRVPAKRLPFFKVGKELKELVDY